MRSTAGGRVFVLFAAVAACAGASATAHAQPLRGLTAAPQVAKVYDAIFDARFGEVPALLKQTCAVAQPLTPRLGKTGLPPAEVCQLLAVVSLLWQIQLDPLNTSRDEAFRTNADAAVAALLAWTVHEPERAEAWFYLGGAYGARVQWRVLRGQQLSAARDGKRIKDALERALSLDPGLEDARFGVGLYHYYADVAPAAAKVLRWLLLLPGGDRVQGIQEMLRARNAGQLLRGEADYQLHLVYLWYEKEPERALELLTALRDRYPRNPHFYQLIAETQDVYLHDVVGSLESWQRLLDAARRTRVNEAEMAEARARLGIAQQLDRLFETDASVDQAKAVVNARPASPAGALAQAHLQLAQALDRLGYRAAAVEEYRAALAATPPGDPTNIQRNARAGLRASPDPATATAYRLSIEGWRALERGALGDAAQALTRSLTLRPSDPVARYRRARLLIAERHPADALAILERLATERASTPPTIYAAACVEAARLHEQQGSDARALALYRTAQSVFGVDERTKDAARRGATRLAASLPTPAR